MTLVFFGLISVGSWVGFWYQVGWGDSWRWGLAFLAINLVAGSALLEERWRR